MKNTKKKRNNRDHKKVLILSLIGLLSLVIVVLCFFSILLKPAYKIENRTIKMEEKKESYKEKVVGWIKVPGTNIDYPTIYNSDEVRLDLVNYDFAWSNSPQKKLGNRELLLGHNILNVSRKPLITDKEHKRFEQLMSYIYYDFAKENLYIQYTKDGENYLYKIFAVGFIEDTKLEYYDINYNKEQLKNYIHDARKNSFFDYEIDVNSNDDILSLVTCTRFYGIDGNVDFKIDARRVRANEAVNKYKVAESSKYDKIKEEMKGDEADEEV